jgi:cyclic pyranopterin monophosphate synthase
MLTHIDKNNNPTMVDVSDKGISSRVATAQATVFLPPELQLLISGDEIKSKKGPVIQTAIIAGTMAVKKTGDLIPFCHPIPIESIKFSSVIRKNHLILSCTVKTTGKTGVEMEALTGVNVAALTVYDMGKAVSHDIRILETQLMEKSGGKRDFNRGEGNDI